MDSLAVFLVVVHVAFCTYAPPGIKDAAVYYAAQVMGWRYVVMVPPERR